MQTEKATVLEDNKKLGYNRKGNGPLKEFQRKNLEEYRRLIELEMK